jgi:hypothetical protein
LRHERIAVSLSFFLFLSISSHNLNSDQLTSHVFSKLKIIMLFSNNCRFALLFFLWVSVNAETIRGAHRELDAATVSTRPAMIDIGSVSTGNYAILAKTGISTVPSSAINGNIGVSPIAATSMTGFSLIADSGNQFSTSPQLVGGNNKAYAADYGGATAVALTTAVSDMETAYTSAAATGLTSAGKLNIGAGAGVLGGDGTTQLSQGVYTFDTSVSITNNIQFNGSDEDIFIIQITGNLLQYADTIVTLVNTENAPNAAGVTTTVPRKENIFWQVSGTVVVKANAHMEGILLAKTAVDFQANSSLNGRVLTQTRCDLNQATITA